MGIAGGIIQIIVLLLPVILAAIATHNSTQSVETRTNEDIEKAIVNGDVDAVNVYLHDKLPDETGGNIK